MNSFKQKIVNWLLGDGPALQDGQGTSRTAVGRYYNNNIEDDRFDHGLNIHVRNAVGGSIVTFRRNGNDGPNVDRNANRPYLIHEDANFELELGKLITLESIR